MTQLFVRLIVVALVGNIAEHSTAVMVALNNKIDGESHWMEGVMLIGV